MPTTSTRYAVREHWRATAATPDSPILLQAKYTHVYQSGKSGVPLPKWRQIIRTQGLATTSFSANRRDCKFTPPLQEVGGWWRSAPQFPWQHYRFYDSSYLNWYHDKLAPLNHFASSAADASDVQAVTSLYAKLREAHHQLQGGVILGELHKTAKLLFDTASRLRGGILSYLTKVSPKGKAYRTKNRGKSTAEKIRSDYLAATFGWQPLVLDSIDLAKTIGRLCHENDRTRFRAGARVEKPISIGSSEIATENTYVQQDIVERHVVTTVYRGFLRGLPYEAGSPPAERIVSMAGFDLRSFVPTVWELLPYSWLVDYFTNVGDVLYALSTDTSIVAGLWKDVIQESVREIVWTPNLSKSKAGYENPLAGWKAGGAHAYGTAGQAENSFRSVTRTPLSQVPWLLPRIKGIDLNWRQFVNIGAVFSRF